MIANPSIPTPVEPKLLDAAFASIQSSLSTGLSWLTTAYGMAERRVEEQEGRIVYFPAVYSGSREYLKVFPDSHLGSFSFFDVDNGLLVDEWQTYNRQRIQSEFALILWFDYRDVYPADHQQRTISNVASDILAVLRNVPGITIERVLDRGDDIYKGYTSQEIKQQYFMRPYGALRFEGEIWTEEQC